MCLAELERSNLFFRDLISSLALPGEIIAFSDRWFVPS